MAGINIEPHLVSLHERTCSMLLMTFKAMEGGSTESREIRPLSENLIDSPWKPGNH